MIGSRFSSRFVRSASLVAVLGLSVVAGCGVDSYEARMKETLEDLKHENKFVGLSTKFMGLTFVPPPGTPVPPDQVVDIAPRIRLPDRPRKFPEIAFRPDSQNPDDASKPIPAERVFPPAPLPQILGFQEEFEQMVNTSSGTRLWHLYVGVKKHPRNPPGSPVATVTADDPNPKPTFANTAAYVDSVIKTLTDDIAKETAADLAAGIPPAPEMPELAWQNVTFLPARRGATPYTWKVLEINRPQLFYVQGGVPTRVQGVCKLMVLDVPGKAPNSDHTVTLMWRYPAIAHSAAEIRDMITSSMGTFEIDPAAPAAAGAPAKPN